jgi:D-3-phosphoglycerate dehydrogenase
VLIADKFEDQGIAGLAAVGCEVTVEPDLGPDTLAEAIDSVRPDVLIVRSTKVPADAMGCADSLRYIIRAGSGFDNIDYVAAGKHGIAVSNCPGMNAVAVAEAAMGHLINLDRRLPEQDQELKAGRWNKKEFGKARGLKGMNILVHGFGAIGSELASRAQAFGMEVFATSRSMSEQDAATLGISLVGKTRGEILEALPRMDVVSIHVPATAETKGSCDAAFFDAMKPGAYFINTSRGPVVDEAALADACNTKGIRAGLDVYCDQPGFKDGSWSPGIARVQGVYCSHHCGASTDQAQQAVADEVVRLISQFKDSGTCENVINSDHLSNESAEA